MARILIGWELGAGRGHIGSMLAMARALVGRGHVIAFAVQRIDAMPGRLPIGTTLYQAPLWPRLIASGEPAGHSHVATLIDILARLGLDRAGCLTGMIRSWDSIFAAFDPHVVIADHAPALLIAAQGRLPTISCGPGFQVPPSTVDPLPRIGGGVPGYDETMILDIVDADLRDAGREPLPALPAMFCTTRALIASFVELDPYGRPTGPDHIAPAVSDWAPPATTPGDEVFVYVNGPLQRDDAFWRGLAATGLTVRAHIPVPDAALYMQIARYGAIVERRPLPWPLIAARSRIAVNHGAHGIMCALLLAGIPQLTLPLDLEKRLHSEALAHTGLGAVLVPGALDAAALTRAVSSLYADRAMADQARSAAPGFAARAAMPFEASVADAAEALL